MSPVTFRPAVRENVPLLIGLAGGTGSGKTYSAMELARGIGQGKKFAVIDTENGRSKHYADQFDFDVAEIHPPFRPSAYVEAIAAAESAGYPVVIVDSASHEWYGEGGCLEWHDEIMGGVQSKNMTAWIQPKREHQKLVTKLLQINAHVILCFRAAPKVEARQGERGLEIVPKEIVGLPGLDGWVPIAEKNMPYEMMLFLLLMADKPGVPIPIKLEEQHKQFVPLNRPLGPETGLALAHWSAGTSNGMPGEQQAEPTVEQEEQEQSIADLEAILLGWAAKAGNQAEAQAAIERRRTEPETYREWLLTQIARAQGGAA